MGNSDAGGGARFTIAFQDIPVDGSSIGVGFEVPVVGIAGQLSNDSLMGSNRAFLEVSFVDSMGNEFADSLRIVCG